MSSHPLNSIVNVIPRENIKFSDIRDSHNFSTISEITGSISLNNSFYGQDFTDGSSYPDESSSTSIYNLIGLAFGSSTFDDTTLNAGISGNVRETFPIASRSTYIFVFSKDSSESSDPESAILTFSNGLDTENRDYVNACDDRGPWGEDTSVVPEGSAYSWVETSDSNSGLVQFYADNTSVHDSYVYLRAYFADDTICSYHLESENNYDKLFIYNVTL